MVDDSPAPERFSLSRWSRRKLAAAREAQTAPAVMPASAPIPAAAVAPAIAAPAAAPPPDRPAAAEALPAVDTLTFESDFAPYLQPKVGEDTQRAALKKLFSDPRFNVMDGLDTYIDDYTKADPMPAGMLDKLANVYGMLKEDVVEDVSGPESPPAVVLEAPESVASETTVPETAIAPSTDAMPPPEDRSAPPGAEADEASAGADALPARIPTPSPRVT